MIRKLLYISTSLLFFACGNEFTQAEQKLENPSGEVSDIQSVELAVKGGVTQDVSASIIDVTSALIPTGVAFQKLSVPSDLEALFTLPAFDTPELTLNKNLSRLILHEAQKQGNIFPRAFSTTAAGTIDVSGEENCISGTIDFTVEADLDNLGTSGTVRIFTTFNNVVCDEGSVDGDVAIETEFDVTASFVKVVELINATISDNEETLNVDFALRVELDALLGDASVEMSVDVNGKSYTLVFEASLSLGEVSFSIVGKDGSLNCQITETSVACDGNLAFEI